MGTLVLEKIDGVWTIGDEVAKYFIKNELKKGWKYEDVLGTLPQGRYILNEKEIDVNLAKHHIIPQSYINTRVKKYAELFDELSTDVDRRRFCDNWKVKLQSILNHPEIQREFGVQYTSTKIGQVMKYDAYDVATHLRDHLSWYPDNLFIGPRGAFRLNDPGSEIDDDILDGLKHSDNEAFEKFIDWIGTDKGPDRLDKLTDKLKEAEKSIIDVLVSLKISAKGPLWNFGENGEKKTIDNEEVYVNWKTNKSFGEAETPLILKDLVIPSNWDTDTVYRKVYIENGDSEGYTNEE